MINRLILLSVAGIAGTLCRYWFSGWVARRVGESFPAGTLLVNLAGCLAIGFLYHLLQERTLIDPQIRTAILVGFLGAFTTFSSFAIQALNLLRDGEFLYAGLYVLVSNLGGLALAWLGYELSRSLGGQPW